MGRGSIALRGRGARGRRLRDRRALPRQPRVGVPRGDPLGIAWSIWAYERLDRVHAPSDRRPPRRRGPRHRARARVTRLARLRGRRRAHPGRDRHRGAADCRASAPGGGVGSARSRRARPSTGGVGSRPSCSRSSCRSRSTRRSTGRASARSSRCRGRARCSSSSNPRTAHALRANGGDYFGLQFAPTTLLQYFRPDAIGQGGRVPVGHVPPLPSDGGRQRRDRHARPHDQRAVVDAGAPDPHRARLVGVCRTRSPAPDGRRAAGAAARAAGAVTFVTTIAFIAQRYLGDFVPLLVLGGLVGAYVLAARLRARRLAARRIAWRIARGARASSPPSASGSTVRSTLVYQRLYNPYPATLRVGMLRFQYDLADAMGAGTPQVDLAHARASGRRRRRAPSASSGGCDALYWSDGESWQLVEGATGRRRRPAPARAPPADGRWHPVMSWGRTSSTWVVGARRHGDDVQIAGASPEPTAACVFGELDRRPLARDGRARVEGRDDRGPARAAGPGRRQGRRARRLPRRDHGVGPRIGGRGRAGRGRDLRTSGRPAPARRVALRDAARAALTAPRRLTRSRRGGAAESSPGTGRCTTTRTSGAATGTNCSVSNSSRPARGWLNTRRCVSNAATSYCGHHSRNSVLAACSRVDERRDRGVVAHRRDLGPVLGQRAPGLALPRAVQRPRVVVREQQPDEVALVGRQRRDRREQRRERVVPGDAGPTSGPSAKAGAGSTLRSSSSTPAGTCCGRARRRAHVG